MSAAVPKQPKRRKAKGAKRINEKPQLNAAEQLIFKANVNKVKQIQSLCNAKAFLSLSEQQAKKATAQHAVLSIKYDEAFAFFERKFLGSTQDFGDITLAIASCATATSTDIRDGKSILRRYRDLKRWVTNEVMPLVSVICPGGQLPSGKTWNDVFDIIREELFMRVYQGSPAIEVGDDGDAAEGIEVGDDGDAAEGDGDAEGDPDADVFSDLMTLVDFNTRATSDTPATSCTSDSATSSRFNYTPVISVKEWRCNSVQDEVPVVVKAEDEMSAIAESTRARRLLRNEASYVENPEWKDFYPPGWWAFLEFGPASEKPALSWKTSSSEATSSVDEASDRSGSGRLSQRTEEYKARKEKAKADAGEVQDKKDAMIVRQLEAQEKEANAYVTDVSLKKRTATIAELRMLIDIEESPASKKVVINKLKAFLMKPLETPEF